MTEEELKEKAEEYARETRIKDENTFRSLETECISETQDYEGNYIYFPGRIIKAFTDGAKSRDEEVEELKAQIEKIKHCMTCKHNTDSQYFCCCELGALEQSKCCYKNNRDKWELAE